MKILRTAITLLLMGTVLSSWAQAWSKKAAQAVFTLKTFKADGTLLGSANWVFVSENGEAVSSFAPFRGADRAVVIDAQGKEWPVETMMGANDMYDVAKFKVAAKKPTALTTGSAASGATVWLVPYSVKKEPVCVSGTVSKAEQFQGSYHYYTLTLQAQEQQQGCPILNEEGQVVGLLQAAADQHSTTSYAVSAPFAVSLHTNGLSMSDAALKTVRIPLAIPDKYDDALLSLFMGASGMDSQQYADYVNRFIAHYPDASDGYVYRARLEVAANEFAKADEDMKKAVKVAEKKDDVHYQYAQLIYQKELLQSDQPYAEWSLQRALEESKEAYALNPQPVYRLQQAQILYSQKQYDESYAIYEELSKGVLRGPDIFLAAAQCKLQKDDKRAAIAQLDSAISTFSRPYVKTAAPYLRAHAQLCMELRRYQLAINDMNDLVALEPNSAELWAEKASYELRVNLFDEALKSAQEVLRLDPQSSDGYLMMGIVQCQKGNKQEGMQNLRQAQSLGNPQAETFLQKYKD